MGLVMVCAGAPAIGQPASAPPAAAVPLDYLPALAGGYFPLKSRATGRTYHIYVRLPQDYAADPAKRFPTVYVLDGDALFPILAATHLFLTIDDKLPEAIVVGIAYGSFDPAVNARGVDFMPPAPDLPPGKSGAAAFQLFLEAELLPAVEARYRADKAKRILFGQSRGGSFVLYSAFTDPDLFWGRIASSPALPPTRDFFYGRPAPATRRDLRLFVGEGPGDLPRLRAETMPWLAAWRDRRDAPWLLTPILVPGGTHSANSPDVYRAAMRLLFNWTPDADEGGGR
jgi:predicted alpha/beta superfamily hydrolase